MLISEIMVGPRVRRDMGDLDALAASIADVGLLQPIVVKPDGTLVAGQRRLEACKRLGWDDVPVHVVRTASDALKALKAERDENTCRKDFTPSEAVAVAAGIEPLERDAARERQAATQGNRQTGVEKFSEPDKGRALDFTAAAVGMSRPTLQKAREVVEAAEREPERYEPIREQMDRTGKVDRAYQELRRSRLVKPETPEMPTDKYHAIVIDPPWPMDKIARDVRPNQVEMDYATMSIDEIAALPIPALFAPDGCHVYLWTTHRFLPDALRLFEAWGVRYQCLMTWVKNVGFTPYSWMYSTEHVLFGRVGSLDLLRLGLRLDFAAKVREHSRKPDEFYELVREASPGPRLDMFSREARDGFQQWGHEEGKFDGV